MVQQRFLPHKRSFPILCIGTIIFLAISVSCKLFIPTATLPPPENKCAVSVDWNGIVPGKSTRQDVVNILGRPTTKGIEKIQNEFFSYYAYQVDRGIAAGYVQDRIFFRSDGIVSWMEVVVADRDGSYHSILESVEQFGNVLDVAYLNNNYDPTNKSQMDVLAGPDQLYVWSNCGVVLDTLPNCSAETLNNSTNDDTRNKDLTFRSPEPHDTGGEPDPDVSNVVLMKFLFPPTTFDGFTDSYMYKIPFGLWDNYVRELNCQ